MKRNFQPISIVFAGLLAFTGSYSEARECVDLFKPKPHISADTESVLEYFSSVAKFESANAFAKSVNAIPTNGSSLFVRLLAPSIWTYARLKVVEGTQDDPVVKMFDGLRSRPFFKKEITSADWIGRERPRIMTGEERRMAQETGNFLHVEPIPVYRTAEQIAARERIDFMQRMIREMETKAGQKQLDRALEPSLVQFNHMVAEGIVQNMTSLQLQRLISQPMEFAITYAATHGLFYKAGDAGLALSKAVPWAQYSRGENAAMIPVRGEFAGLARSLFKNPAERRAFDNSVLETLRAQFAPTLHVSFDVGEAP